MRLENDLFFLSATDLTNHLGCRHLTELTRKELLGEPGIRKPYRNDPTLEVLKKRGAEHEKAYVEHLHQGGKTVRDVRNQGPAATLAAMREGVDVIVQATLAEHQWRGYADILMKVDKPSSLGNWSYEVMDTKLAQHTRAATILQLCLYSDLLARLQDMQPERMYVVKPGFVVEDFRVSDFLAYYRLVKTNFEQTIAGPAIATYPEPVAHCDICDWWKHCDTQRRHDDHLSLVAGIRTLHIEELRRQHINTLEALATADTIAKPKRGNYETFLKKKSQAKVQLDGRVASAMLYEFLPAEDHRGFNRLPEPNAGDICFDIEGDAFYPDGGLEYLLGYAFRDNGDIVYRKTWATSRQEEKNAFRAFMEFLIARRKKYPDLHIYHFAPYEPTAIKRLARVHALYESEVDELLRGERFVDLHRVFREAMLASVERYSLKDLEKFTTYTRQVDLHEASRARKAVECALELNEINTIPPDTLETVARYNEDDCLATLALHAWLEKRRAEEIAKGKPYERPAPQDTEPGEKVRELEKRARRIFESLTRHLPEDRDTWNDEHRALWLLANQVDYFRREDKSAWWEYFRVHKLEHEELLDERKAVTGLVFKEELPLKKRERVPTHRYTFPPQEIGITDGDKLVEVEGDDIGTCAGVSPERYTIDIKKSAKTADRHPVAVHVFDRIDPGSLATSLMNLANEIDENGLAHQWAHRASKDLLMKRKPLFTGGVEGTTLLSGEDPVAGAIRLAMHLDRSILPIQGPPGTGKTYTGASIIIALVKAGKKVGITATSHSVIRTLCEKVNELCTKENYPIRVTHKVSSKSDDCPEWVTEETDTAKTLNTLNEKDVIVGGTAWLWADDKAVDTLDYLFIDEAGQMSLSQALAASRAAKNIILLGDPQQLEQPTRGAHPEGSDVAALTWLLEGNATMPDGKGLFLGVTRRLHPAIAAFTSEIFYEGRLESLPGLEHQRISGGTPFDGAGLFYVPVEHKGNQNRADEEIDRIVAIVNELLQHGQCTNADGHTQPLTPNDILIVAPYNAQVAALKEKLPDVPTGTVDKFQGKEAPVVIYSMTSSSADDAPRGMNFLFNPNRLNVATSRARSVCVLVASPRLLEPECHTIDQMRWSNAVCRYVEMAGEEKVSR